MKKISRIVGVLWYISGISGLFFLKDGAITHEDLFGFLCLGIAGLIWRGQQ